MASTVYGVVFASVITAGALTLASDRTAMAKDYGQPGEPIELTVGYQPYYTQSWSGIVMAGKELWKKYLPEGSEVEFQVGLQGAIIVGQMLAEKQDIGYMGDMPSISAVTRGTGEGGTVDLRIVANLGLSQQQCNIFFVRNDAPEFETPEDAVNWMDGKTVAVPQGSCTDRFARAVFEQTGVEPGQYLNQNIEVISTNFRAGKLDAAVIWEPAASDLVEKGIARRVASGIAFNLSDAGNLVFNHELMKQRPDVLRGWLQAELEAQRFIADPKNATEVIEMVQARTTGIPKSALWQSAYGYEPSAQVPLEEQIKDIKYFVVSDEVRSLLKDATAFLHRLKKVRSPELRPEAIDDAVAREILAEQGLTTPIAVIRAQSPERSPFKAQDVAQD
jgi:NitT/TauT family transport system substrate-binding protein